MNSNKQESTHDSYLNQDITKRKCFCRKCLGRCTESIKINKKKVITKKVEKKSFNDIIDLFSKKDSKLFLNKFINLDLSFDKWKVFNKNFYECYGKILYNKFLDNIDRNLGLYEIPTQEQMNVLCPLIKNLLKETNSEYLTCLASGRALMEYFLNLNKVPLVCNSITLGFEQTNDPFMKVNNKSIIDTEYTNKSKVIYISWIHSSFEDELIKVILKNRFISALVLSGEIYGGCYSEQFSNKLLKLGFSKKILWTKGISKNDHNFVVGDGPMSYTTIFYRSEIKKEIIMKSFDKKYLFSNKVLDKKIFVEKQCIIDTILKTNFPDFLLDIKDKPISHYNIIAPFISVILKGILPMLPFDENMNYDKFYKILSEKKNENIVSTDDLIKMLEKKLLLVEDKKSFPILKNLLEKLS